MSENTRTRKQDIVFLNVLFCMLVIFIHISSEIVTEMPKSTIFFKTVFSAHRLSSFVVQGFLLLSGAKLFISNNEKINYARHYFRRFTRIVIPYLIWVFIYYCYFCSEEYFTFSLKELGSSILNGDLSAHFYFVVILVQFEILVPLWRFLYKRGNASVHIAFALIVTVIANQYLMPILTTLFPSMPMLDMSNCFLRYQIYWTAGCMIGIHYRQFQEYLRKNKIMITLGFLFCASLNVALSLATVAHYPTWLEFIHIMYCMSAILFFYMVAQLFDGSKLLKPLSFVDKSSYTIYLVHCLVIFIANDYMTDRGILDLGTRYGFRAGAVYGISIALGVIWQIIKIPLSKLIRKS